MHSSILTPVKTFLIRIFSRSQKKETRSVGRWRLPESLKKSAGTLVCALFVPVSVLALAGLIQISADWLGRAGWPYAAVLQKGGYILFRYTPLVVAVVVAVHGVNRLKEIAALSAIVSSLVWLAVADSLVLHGPRVTDASFNLGWLTGLAVGLITVGLFRVMDRIKRPSWSLKYLNAPVRVVLIGLLGIPGGVLSALLWNELEYGLARVARWMADSGDIGMFIFGVLHRLFTPLGLHTILDDALWYQYGSFITREGILVHGDLNRFLAGDPTAGWITAGLFPATMMLVPAILLALFWIRHSEKKKTYGLLLLFSIFLSIAGGLSEPADFFILLLAPGVYLVYALLTGLGLLLSVQMNSCHGFSLAPGLMDFIDHWEAATRPEWLVLIGVILGVLGFVVSFFLTKWTSRIRMAKADNHVESVPREEDS